MINNICGISAIILFVSLIILPFLAMILGGILAVIVDNDNIKEPIISGLILISLIILGLLLLDGAVVLVNLWIGSGG